MRRIFLCALYALAFVYGVGIASANSAQAALEPTQLAPRLWFVEGNTSLGSVANRNFISNAGFVVTDDGVVVIDALGSPVLAQELIDAIHKITPLPIKYVIATHYHADHIYGLQQFQAIGATVIAHQGAREYLFSDAAQKRLETSRTELAPWINAQTRLVPADQWVTQQSMTLRVGSFDFVIHHVGPAHTPEDIVVYVPKLRALFAGDIFFRGRIPFVGNADSRLWIASLNRLLSFQPTVVVPGHGPASFTPMADMELTRNYLLYLRHTMGAAAKNMEPFDEAYAKTDWSPFQGLPLFHAANRMNAYNTYLLMEQQNGPDSP